MRTFVQSCSMLLSLGLCAFVGCTSSGSTPSKPSNHQNSYRPYNPKDPRPNYGSIFPQQSDLQDQAILKQKQAESKAKTDPSAQ